VKTCPDCKGSGYNSPEAPGDYVAAFTECKKCKGTGLIERNIKSYPKNYEKR